MKTAREICEELGIEIVPTNVRRSTLGERQCCAERTIDKMIAKHGEEHVRFVLITISETVNNGRELVAPTIEAVSDVVLAHPTWIREASIWLKMFDRLDLSSLRAKAKRNARACRVREALATMIFDRLYQVFEPTPMV